MDYNNNIYTWCINKLPDFFGQAFKIVVDA